MLKLKLVAAILALAGMVSLLLGDTYLSVAIAAGVSTLQDVNILNVPLGATIDYSQLGNVRYCVSFVGIISVILTVITPSCSSKRDDDDSDDKD